MVKAYGVKERTEFSVDVGSGRSVVGISLRRGVGRPEQHNDPSCLRAR